MKSKLLLCLALCLVAGLAGCSSAHPRSTAERLAPAGIWAKHLKTSWTNTAVVLHRANGEVVPLDAKQAVYTVKSINPAKPGKAFDRPVLAFMDPATRNVWIGGVDTGEVETNDFLGLVTYTNIFFESSAGIFRGGNVLTDGTFDCDESVIQKAQPGENLEAVIERYDKTADGPWPLSGAVWISTFQDAFRENFFYSGNLGSQSTPIQRVVVENGKLRLDFKSQKYGTTGNVWLDLNTLKVCRAVENK